MTMKFDDTVPRALARWLPALAAMFKVPGKVRRKATSPDDPPPAGEAAWADGLFFGSVPLERWNPDELLARHGGRIYRRMMEDDQIKALVAFKRAAVLNRPWTFELPRNTPEHRRCEAFFRFLLGQVLRGTFGQALDGMMTSQVTGFSVVEKVYEGVEWEGSAWWGISALKLRPAASFTFAMDAHGNLTGLSQQQGTLQVSLPPERFIRHVNKPEAHPHYGESDLKECHRHWWAKENILKFWNIYLERMAAGFVHGRLSGTLTAAEQDDLKRALSNLNSRTSIITPESVKLEMVTAPSTDVFERAVAARDKAMARALLVPNQLGYSEPGQTGSYSQSRVQLDAFLYVVNALADSLADTLNEQLFRELARWNFGLNDPPRFVFDPMTGAQKRELAQAWREAVASGTVTQGSQDERRTRELLGYPAPEAA
jgi:phage gp29-like protein